MNTNFNVTDQELAAANGGVNPALALKVGAKIALKTGAKFGAAGAKHAAGGAAGYGIFRLLGLA